MTYVRKAQRRCLTLIRQDRRMAKVIDRLRVQGISPSREGSLTSSHMTRSTASSNSQPDKGWIPHGDGFCMANQRKSKYFLTSVANPAARRAEVLMRMRTANHGLSTMDTNFGPTSVQFVLRGKPATNQPNKPLRAESSKITAPQISPPLLQRTHTQDIYHERQIKVHIGKAHSEPASSAVVNNDIKRRNERDDTSLPQFSSPFFMLGSSQSPSCRATSRRTIRSSEGFELTGRKMEGHNNDLLQTGFNDIYPHIVSPVRSQKRWTRNVLRDPPPPLANFDPMSLNRCLHVHQSIRLPIGTQDEAIKLKHFTQFIKKDGKVSQNNPYRKIKRKERRTFMKSDSQYQFDSVSSYIHFNRIYQQPSSDRTVTVNVPRMNGFPAHCTDTVLLRMMLEMNKPLRKTPDRYSDVAVQRDLDDYLMVRSPSGLSKTASARSKKTGRLKSGKGERSDIAREVPTSGWADNVVQEHELACDQEREEEKGNREEENAIEEEGRLGGGESPLDVAPGITSPEEDNEKRGNGRNKLIDEELSLDEKENVEWVEEKKEAGGDHGG